MGHECSHLCSCDSMLDLTAEEMSSQRLERMQSAVATLIRGCGEDLQREGLIDTPRRVAKAWLDLAGGLQQECQGAFGTALFHEPIISAGPDGLVLVRDITFAFLSERTLLPCHGRVHIAYVPRGGQILGLSKLARATKCLASRIQTQQRFASDLLAAVQQAVQPAGAAVVAQATHMCGVRGLEPEVASACCGCFADPAAPCMQELATLLRMSSGGLAAGMTASVPAATPAHAHTDRAGPATAAMVAAVNVLLEGVGEETARQGLAGSAESYVDWLLATTAGYRMPPPPRALDVAPPTPDPASPADLSDASSCEDCAFAEGSCYVGLREQRELNLLASPAADTAAAECSAGRFGCWFSSQCEHHLLPFYGTLRVAYEGAAADASHAAAQLRHVVAMFSRRLQVQERLSQQVAESALDALGAASVLVVCESTHMCMVARGVEKHASSTVTTACRGRWAAASAARAAALERLMELR